MDHSGAAYDVRATSRLDETSRTRVEEDRNRMGPQHHMHVITLLSNEAVRSVARAAVQARLRYGGDSSGARRARTRCNAVVMASFVAELMAELMMRRGRATYPEVPSMSRGRSKNSHNPVTVATGRSASLLTL